MRFLFPFGINYKRGILKWHKAPEECPTVKVNTNFSTLLIKNECVNNFFFATENTENKRVKSLESGVNKIKIQNLRLTAPDCKIVYSVVLLVT